MFEPTENIELAAKQNIFLSETADDGTTIVCATINKFVLLKEVSWDQLIALAHQFAEALDRALLKLFLTPAKETHFAKARSADPLLTNNLDSPLALSLKCVKKLASGRLNVHGNFCRTSNLEKAMQRHALLPSAETELPSAWSILRHDHEVQIAVARDAILPTIRTMEWAIEASGLDLVASERVIELLRATSNSWDFFDAVCSAVMTWVNDPTRKFTKGVDTSHFHRPLALAWFCAWLCERGYLLFPVDCLHRGTEFFPYRFRDMLPSLLRDESAIAERANFFKMVTILLSKREVVRNRMRVSLDAADLLCPGIARGVISAECVGHLKSFLPRGNRAEHNIYSVVWKLEVARLKAKGIDRSKLKRLAFFAVHAEQHARSFDVALWSWVDNANSGHEAGSKYARSGFRAGPNLVRHVGELRRIFPIIAGKSASAINTTFGIWLFFLSFLPDEEVPPSLLDVTPTLLDSVRDDVKNTLRIFLELHAISPSLQVGLFSAIRRGWKILAREAGSDAICPISDQLNGLRKGTNRRTHYGSTGRRAIDMEILELLIAENRANNFAFSRHRGQVEQHQNYDYRLVTDPKMGNLTSVWWPGLAVLLDTLLQIPLRHKQGRYLDSGEGDEFTLDIESLSLVPNDLPTATKGRNEAFLQRVSLSPLRDEPGLGMFINTNKTGKEYEFPWLLPDIAANVQMVIDWQKQYNPIGDPVSDRKDTKAERAANAEQKLVYPIFRDPLNADHAPVNESRVLEYFRGLLRVVQDKYNLANHTNVSFFRPNGEPVYDIHALRVTGVTRLLQLGVDVRIVRLLVGHSSLAMTWYYEDVSNQRICSAMERTLELVRPTKERLLAMSQAERETFLAELFTKSDTPPHTFNLLRGMIEENSPFLDIRVDGICPGMRCADAGVWRTRACSLCKYNISGPAFLAGIALVMNDLMAELILNQRVLEGLRDLLYERRAEGSSTRSLEAEIAKKEEFLDHVLQQWEAQFQYLKLAEAKLSIFLQRTTQSSDEDRETSPLMLVSPTSSRLALSLQESHHLSLFTRLIEGAKNIDGFSPAIGVRENRDQMLLEIARHEQLTDLFYRLSPPLRRAALDQFALLLMEEELSVEGIQALLDGDVSLSSLERPSRWLEDLARSNPTLMTKVKLPHGQIDFGESADPASR